YKVLSLIATGLSRLRDTSRSRKTKYQQRDDWEMHQQPAHPYEGFTDPERHAEIEGQDAIVKADAQQELRRDRWRRRECGESSLERKVDSERDEPDDSPADIVGNRDAEVKAWIRVVINLPQEPAVSAEGHRIDDHVNEGKQESG